MAEGSRTVASSSATQEEPATNRKAKKATAKDSANKKKASRKQEDSLSAAWTEVTASEDEERSDALVAFLRTWSAHEKHLANVLSRTEAADDDTTGLIRVCISHDIVTLLLANLMRTKSDDATFEAIASEITEALKRAERLEAKSAPLKSASEEKESQSEMSGVRGSARDLEPSILRFGGGSKESKQTEEYEDMDNYRSRDERGRFADDDDRERSSRRSYDDDRRRGGREDDHRGWYGDSRGHAEAAHRGWESRRGEGRYDDEDDRYRLSSRSRSSRDEDDYDDRRGRGHGGWFGDSEGHSRAARGQSQSRSSGRHESDDDYGRRSRSRSSDYDYDDRGRGHGGWFGDSEGHSEASQRGWEGRRDDDDRGGGRRR